MKYWGATLFVVMLMPVTADASAGKRTGCIASTTPGAEAIGRCTPPGGMTRAAQPVLALALLCCAAIAGGQASRRRTRAVLS